MAVAADPVSLLSMLEGAYLLGLHHSEAELVVVQTCCTWSRP